MDNYKKYLKYKKKYLKTIEYKQDGGDIFGIKLPAGNILTNMGTGAKSGVASMRTGVKSVVASAVASAKTQATSVVASAKTQATSVVASAKTQATSAGINLGSHVASMTKTLTDAREQKKIENLMTTIKSSTNADILMKLYISSLGIHNISSLGIHNLEDTLKDTYLNLLIEYKPPTLNNGTIDENKDKMYILLKKVYDTLLEQEKHLEQKKHLA
jgi:hypothetical protein